MLQTKLQELLENNSPETKYSLYLNRYDHKQDKRQLTLKNLFKQAVPDLEAKELNTMATEVEQALTLDTDSPAVALFCTQSQLDRLHQPDELDKNPVTLTVLPCFHEVDDSITIADTYNIQELVLDSQYWHKHLIAHIDEKSATIYALHLGKVLELDTIDNPFETASSPEFFDNYRMNSNKSTVHGGGHDKHQRREQDVAEGFLSQVTDKLAELQNRDDYDQVVFVADSSWQKHIDEDVTVIPHGHEPVAEHVYSHLTSNTTIPDSVQVLTDANDIYEKASTHAIQDLYITGLNTSDVVKPSIPQQVDVFKVHTLHDTYTTTQPWLINTVVQSGGNIHAQPTEDADHSLQAVARY